MRQAFKTTLIVAALTVFAVGSAQAGGKKRGDGMHKHQRGDRVEMMIRHLDLTPEQVETMKKLRAEMDGDISPLVEKERELKRAIRDEWSADNPDEDKLIKLHRKAIKLKSKIGEVRIEYRVDVINNLTAEQRAKLKDFRKAGIERRNNKRSGDRGMKDGRAHRGKRSIDTDRQADRPRGDRKFDGNGPRKNGRGL